MFKRYLSKINSTAIEVVFVLFSFYPLLINLGVYLSWLAATHYLGAEPRVNIDDPKDIEDGLTNLFYYPTALSMVILSVIYPLYPLLFGTRLLHTLVNFKNLSWIKRLIIFSPLISILLIKYINNNYDFDEVLDPAWEWFRD